MELKTVKIENVRKLDRYNSRKVCLGKLFLTVTALVFIDSETRKETWILYWHIATVDKLPLSTTGSPLQVRCKTFHSVIFVLPRERDCHEVFNSLLLLSQPRKIEDLFCFRSSGAENVPKAAGWNFFDVQAEFQRMGVPNDQWVLTLLNKNYELCDTYPSVLFVPATASSFILTGSSKFRSKGRLPVLTYLHKNKAAIVRCSQPLSGFNARCLEDEQMLNCIARTNPASSHMVVVDTRPRINAMANRATGKGYENEHFYDNIKFHFSGIENIHVMRSSLAKLIETCELKHPSMSAFLNGMESSGWLKHIKYILDTSWYIAKTIESGVNVLVHCSDGWDRTAQVCSLASMLLDPFYRTIQGFQALIEKDWLSFGFKFTDRIGHVAGDTRDISPVFTQFIDCTWQLMEQYPSAFQFNEGFLFTIHDHSSSCQHGTFIGNCEKERIDLRLKEKTFSVWGIMANHTCEYMNPLYDQNFCDGLLKLNLIPQTVRFWRGLYCRFESGVHPREIINEYLLVAKFHCDSLKDHIKLLQKKIKTANDLANSPPVKIKYEVFEKPKLDSFIMIKNERSDEFPSSPTKSLKALNQNVMSSGDEVKLETLSDDLSALALDWKSFRQATCQGKDCVKPFEHPARKTYCWQCGNIFCTRCIKLNKLPGHSSQWAAPVCDTCYKKINQSLSVETP